MKILANILLLIVSISSFGQSEFWGGPSAGYGATGLSSQDVWALEYNQAGLANIQKFETAIAYQSPFLLQELSQGKLIVAMPAGDGAFGLSLQNSGFSLYQQGVYSLAYGRKLGSDFSLGVQFNYHSVKFGEGYASTTALTVEGGFQYAFNDALTLAGHLSNPNQSTISNSEEKLPSIMRGGLGYEFSEKVTCTFEVWKQSNQKAQIHTGISYRAADLISLGIGMSSAPGKVYGGIQLHLKGFEIGLASTYHNVLGYSPQISITYRAS